jgi:hypothetical protein
MVQQIREARRGWWRDGGEVVERSRWSLEGAKRFQESRGHDQWVWPCQDVALTSVTRCRSAAGMWICRPGR